MKKYLWLPCCLLLALCAACAAPGGIDDDGSIPFDYPSSEVSSVTSESVLPPDPISEDVQEYTNSEGKVIMTSRISVETLLDSAAPGASVINAQLATAAANARAAANELSLQAEADDATETPYYMDVEYIAAYVGKSLVCYLCTEETFSGGVTSQTTQTSLCFDSTTGAAVTSPDEVFSVDPAVYLPRIWAEVIGQIESSRASLGDAFPYYENYGDAVRAAQLNGRWYVSDDGLVVFFNPYDIAPHAAGVREFCIPFANIADIFICSLVQ